MYYLAGPALVGGIRGTFPGHRARRGPGLASQKIKGPKGFKSQLRNKGSEEEPGALKIRQKKNRI